MSEKRPIVAINWSMDQFINISEIYSIKKLLKNEPYRFVERIIFPSNEVLKSIVQISNSYHTRSYNKNLALFFSESCIEKNYLKSLLDINGRYIKLGNCGNWRTTKPSLELLNNDLLLSLNFDISVVICIEQNKKINDEYSLYLNLKYILSNVLKNLKEEQFERLTIAYVPQWTFEKSIDLNIPYIHFVFRTIKEVLYELFLDHALVNEIRIIYGGNFSLGNAVWIINNENVDGFLVNKIEEDANGFEKMIKSH